MNVLLHNSDMMYSSAVDSFAAQAPNDKAYCGRDFYPHRCWKRLSSGGWCYIQRELYCLEASDCDTDAPCYQ